MDPRPSDSRRRHSLAPLRLSVRAGFGIPPRRGPTCAALERSKTRGRFRFMPPKWGFSEVQAAAQLRPKSRQELEIGVCSNWTNVRSDIGIKPSVAITVVLRLWQQSPSW